MPDELYTRYAIIESGKPTVGPRLLDGRTPGWSSPTGGEALYISAARTRRWPELWLLDEPHAGLDAEHRELLDGLVRDAVARGATVVLASHEHERALAIAGRVVTMAGGM